MISEIKGVSKRLRTLAASRTAIYQRTETMNPSEERESNEVPMNKNVNKHHWYEWNHRISERSIYNGIETNAKNVDGSKSYVDGVTQRTTDEVDWRNNVCTEFP